MKIIIMRIIFLVFVLNMSVMYAEDNVSWYDNVVNYTNEVIHDVTTDDVTFEALYKESSSLGWITAAVFAVVATVVLVYSGGTAAPALVAAANAIPGVTAIGSLFGGAGLVGAAATTSGLAFLGAGSMAAGIIVVGSALTFGTSVVIDYAATKALDTYSYSGFVENSKNMMTLPLPKNTDGCDSYESAMSILEGVNSEIPLSSEETQLIIKKAIDSLNVYDDDINIDEKAKKESLYALLYFISNNHKKAIKHADVSISLANEVNIKHTLPSYIVATSSLYDENFDYNELADKYLKYSFMNEVDNPILSLLLSIHMDRMMYRYSDGMIDEMALNKVFKIVSDEVFKNLRLQNYIIVLSRYIIALKLEQQKISSLALTDNKTIKNSPKTLLAIKKTYVSYEKLIDGSMNIIDQLEAVKVETETEIEAKKQVETFKELISQYSNDKTRLQGLIQDLEAYQSSLSIEEVEEIPETQEVEIVKDDKNIYLYIGFSIIFLIMMMLFIIRKKRVEGISKNFNLKVK